MYILINFGHCTTETTSKYRGSWFSLTSSKILRSSSLEAPPSFHKLWIGSETLHLPEGFFSHRRRSRASFASFGHDTTKPRCKRMGKGKQTQQSMKILATTHGTKFLQRMNACVRSSVFDFCGTPRDDDVGVEALEVGGDGFGITRLGGVSGGPLAGGWDLDFNSSIAFKAASSFACRSRFWSFIVIKTSLLVFGWVKIISNQE